MILTKQLINTVCAGFQLDLKGIHGVAHWSRVAYNGRILHHLMPEVDLVVTQLFAFIHDSQRESDGSDDQHGPRAARWAEEQQGKLFRITDKQLELLVTACDGHTGVLFSRDITVQACWDADRLDIGRCKTNIDPFYLGTSAAKLEAVQRQAMARSRANITRL